MVIGEERAVGELWDAARRRMPRAARRSARPARLRAARAAGAGRDGPPRGARATTSSVLVPACAAAHLEEIGIDPLARDPEGFRWRTRQQIEEGRSWLWLEDGVIRFKAEASAWTPSAVQLQQVWVDPEARRRGYARRGAARPLPAAARAVPAVCLFVRPENDAGAAPLRLDRHDARADLPLPGLLGGTIGWMEELRDRVERFVREHELIPPGGEVTCLVSGGADSTCLWHVLGALGYRVSALHVNHRLRGAESDEDARFCAEVLGAEVVELDGRGLTEASSATSATLSARRDRLRATGHTASDQVETILYRLVSRGAPTGIQPRSDDGVVHPLLPLWREETEAYCGAAGLAFRLDSSNADTKRGLIRDEILPLLRRLHPGRRREPPARARRARDAAAGARRAARLAGRLEARRPRRRPPGRARARAALARAGPVELAGEVGGASGRSARSCQGLECVAGGPATGLAGGARKIQDVFVDAKVPRSEREAWPLVVRGDEVVAVPGIVEQSTEVERCARRTELETERGRGGPDRGGAAPAADRASSAPRSPPTTRAATCCSSASSRAPSSSWPT